MTNTASQVIKIANLQLQYFRFRKEIPSLEFIEAKQVKRLESSNDENKIEIDRWKCASCGKFYKDKTKPKKCTCGSVSIIMYG